MTDPAVTHADDQLDGYAVARAKRTGLFYAELRRRQVPAVVAGVLTLVDLAGYHWPRNIRG